MTTDRGGYLAVVVRVRAGLADDAPAAIGGQRLQEQGVSRADLAVSASGRRQRLDTARVFGLAAQPELARTSRAPELGQRRRPQLQPGRVALPPRERHQHATGLELIVCQQCFQHALRVLELGLPLREAAQRLPRRGRVQVTQVPERTEPETMRRLAGDLEPERLEAG